MKNKKRNNLVIFALSILVFVPLVSMAASDDSALSIKKNLGDRGFQKGDRNMNMNKRLEEIDNQENLTDEEREAKRTEMDAERKEMDELIKNMTTEEREAMRAKRKLERDIMLKNREKIEAAMDAGDYEAWLELAKDTNCPFLSEVTVENFTEFVEKHKNMNGDKSEKERQGRGLRMNINRDNI